MIVEIIYYRFNVKDKNLSFPPEELESFGRFTKVTNRLYEKRKREQIYTYLDILLSNYTVFDFFTKESFELLIISKKLAALYEHKYVTEDIFLLSFFYLDAPIKEELKNSGVTYEKVLKKIQYIKPASMKRPIPEMYLKKLFRKITKIFKKKVEIDSSFNYISSLCNIFTQCLDKAIEVYKTPVITPEILFITLMDSDTWISSRVLKEVLTNEPDWVILRYRLVKALYKEESIIKNNLDQNQFYFAYLLKIYLPKTHFLNLADRELLTPGILYFRQLLLLNLLSFDFYAYLEREVNLSIKLTSTRQYKHFKS